MEINTTSIHLKIIISAAMFRTNFPNYRQLDRMDCGPTCLRIIAKHYGKEINLEFLRRVSHINRTGVSLAGIKEAAKQIGFDTFSVLITWADLIEKVPLPCIVHWEENHFMVVYKLSNSKVYISDPGKGKYTLSHDEFRDGLLSEGKKGVAMLLEPNIDFFPSTEAVSSSFSYLIKYIFGHRKLLWQIVIGLFLSSIIQLSLPFFTQSIVDYGIENQDFKFIQIVLVGQVFFILSQGAIEILRDWILLHISTRMNIRMMSDYLDRLIQLPMLFFAGRSTGDLIQRINDNSRIEDFLTNGSLTFLFDVFNILLFSLVLAYYNLNIFLVFIVGSIIYFTWSLAFMKKKALLDMAYFGSSSKSQAQVLQIIKNIEDIKINGSHERRKQEWYQTQLELHNITSKNLRINQVQLNGGQIINEIKNIIIIILSAYAVIEGVLSLGVMLAIQFIIAQLSVPISKIIDFLLDYQKASLSVERLFEVQKERPEGEGIEMINNLADDENIEYKNVFFRYGPPESKDTLSNITVTIPKGKITALVGPSGSGKSTFLKLLLSFYQPFKGEIIVGQNNLKEIPPEVWRSKCGVVLQDGKLFDDTIERNITESKSDFPVDLENYKKAIKFAMLNDFIEKLPHKSKTKVGENGALLSGGEKQKVLIARAIYKNPKYFFLDEATSSLDSINEKNILENLETFYKDKTVVIIAHRLSTIKNADNIIVLNNGELMEQGTHKKLMSQRGYYWRLIENQLDKVENG